MCEASSIVGNSFYNDTTSHRFRATMIQCLLDAEHPETVIAKRSGHKDVGSMRSYNYLRGTQGIEQQRELFGDAKKKKETTCDSHGGKKAKTENVVKSEANRVISMKNQASMSSSGVTESVGQVVSALLGLSSIGLNVTNNLGWGTYNNGSKS